MAEAKGKFANSNEQKIAFESLRREFPDDVSISNNKLHVNEDAVEKVLTLIDSCKKKHSPVNSWHPIAHITLPKFQNRNGLTDQEIEANRDSYRNKQVDHLSKFFDAHGHCLLIVKPVTESQRLYADSMSGVVDKQGLRYIVKLDDVDSGRTLMEELESKQISFYADDGRNHSKQPKVHIKANMFTPVFRDIKTVCKSIAQNGGLMFGMTYPAKAATTLRQKCVPILSECGTVHLQRGLDRHSLTPNFKGSTLDFQKDLIFEVVHFTTPEKCMMMLRILSTCDCVKLSAVEPHLLTKMNEDLVRRVAFEPAPYQVNCVENQTPFMVARPFLFAVALLHHSITEMPHAAIPNGQQRTYTFSMFPPYLAYTLSTDPKFNMGFDYVVARQGMAVDPHRNLM